MSERSWFGEIPHGWEVVPLYAVAAERKMPNKGLRETNLLSLSYGNIVRKDINTNEGLLPASFETYQVVEPDDVVLRLTDLQNDQRSLRSALVRERGIITSAYLALSLRDVEPRFAAYQLRAIDLMKVFYSMGGGLRQSIGYGDLKRLPLALPPKQQQQTIADYLDRETAQIDAFIAKNEELITLLNERRLSVMTTMIERHGSGAPRAALRNLALVLDCKHVTAEAAAEGSGYAVASIREIKGKWVDTKNARRTSAESFRNLGEGGRQLRPWDLLICRNTSVGKLALVPQRIEPTVMGQDVSLVRIPNRDIARFVYYVLSSATGRDAFESASIGSTFRRINVDDIKAIRVPLLSPEIGRHVADSLDVETLRIDRAIARATRAIELARERRAALISAAVTGKIDVGVVA